MNSKKDDISKSNYRGTAVLVDPIITGTKYLESCEKLNLYPLVVLSQSISYYQSLPKLMRPTDSLLSSAIFFEDLKETKKQIQSRVEGNILAAVPGFETAVELSDLLAQEFSVPSNVIELSSARRDKGPMKDIVGSSGLRVAKYTSCSNSSELQDAIKNIGLPIVIKNPRGCGSHLVEICHSKSEALDAFNSILNHENFHGEKITRVLAEEYLDGQEFTVNLLVDSNGPHVTDIWKYDRRDFSYARNLYYQFDFGSGLPNDQELELISFAKKVTTSLGIRIGFVHAEIKWTKSGPALIEAASRPCGAKIPWILEKETKFDLFFESLKTHLGETTSIDSPLNPRSKIRLIWCPNENEGTIKRIHGLKEIEKLSSLKASVVFAEENTHVSPTRDSWTNPFFCVLASENSDVIEKETQFIRENFKLEMQP